MAKDTNAGIGGAWWLMYVKPNLGGGMIKSASVSCFTYGNSRKLSGPGAPYGWPEVPVGSDKGVRYDF